MKKIDLFNFIPFYSTNRVYDGKDMFYNQKMDFSWSMKVLGCFMPFSEFVNYGQFFNFFGEHIFVFKKTGQYLDIHINFHAKIFKIDYDIF